MPAQWYKWANRYFPTHLSDYLKHKPYPTTRYGMLYLAQHKEQLCRTKQDIKAALLLQIVTVEVMSMDWY
jgi:hypothetical protein